jgi:hypothetical protein
LSQTVELAADQESLLALLRTKGLSIKDLDEKRKDELRRFLEYLHIEKGLSLGDIAKLIGNKTSGYTSWLSKQLGVKARPFEEARLKGIKEKRRKYERKPFDGTDEDRAYLLGLRHGDLSISRPWKGVVRVSTSTTHPAMVQLFRTLFEPYGHVYQYARYKKDTRTYEWNIQVIVDDCFSFLFQSFEESKEWVAMSQSRIIAYLSGFLDAEGSILVTRSNRGYAVVFVDYFNEDKSILDWISATATNLGLGVSLRINKPIGRGTTGFHLNHNKEYWQLSIFKTYGIIEFVGRLRPRHPEKIERRSVALKVRPHMRYDEISEQVVSLRSRIKADVAAFVHLAEATYLKTHPAPDVAGTA